MFNWIREWYALKAELAEKKAELVERLHTCQSCEVLKTELNRANLKEQQLLSKIFELTAVDDSKDEMQPAVPRSNTPIALGKTHVPWRVRQQALEQADREKASIIQAFHKKNAEIIQNGRVDVRAASDPTLSVEELEKKLGIVSGEV